MHGKVQSDGIFLPKKKPTFDIKCSQVSLTDNGSILFPSITICKNEMFVNATMRHRGLITRLRSGEISPENAKVWLRNGTVSRTDLVKFLSMKTVEGSDSNNYPCNTVSGPRSQSSPLSLVEI